MRKKSWMYAAALVCALGLFTACSDDDDMPNIPDTEITPDGGNLTVTVNGTAATTGSARFEVKNPSEAVLTLTGVIPGYQEVAVDVELESQSGNSYRFAGEAQLSAAPSAISRADASYVLMTVSVEGSVTAEGKASVTATTLLSQQAQGGIAGEWNVLQKLTYDENSQVVASPLLIEWDVQPAISMLGSALGGSLIYNLLNKVDLAADGNITARYWADPEITTDVLLPSDVDWVDDFNCIFPAPAHNWASSPKNLAFWYAKNGMVYVVPSISAIIEQVQKDSGESLEGGQDISTLLASLLGQLAQYNIDVTTLATCAAQWMQEGVPLKYTQEGSTLKLYADKELAAPVVEALLPALPVLDAKLAELVAADPEMGMYVQLICGMLGVEKLADLQAVWEQTQTFNIGLTLTTDELVNRSATRTVATRHDDKVAQFAECLKALLKK